MNYSTRFALETDLHYHGLVYLSLCATRKAPILAPAPPKLPGNQSVGFDSNYLRFNIVYYRPSRPRCHPDGRTDVLLSFVL